MAPYLGVTGVVTPEDVTAVLDATTALAPGLSGAGDRASDHAGDRAGAGSGACAEAFAGAALPRIMAGVLVSARTMEGEVVPNRRYPAAGEIPALLSVLRRGAAQRGLAIDTALHYNRRSGPAGDVGRLVGGGSARLDDELAALVALTPDVQAIQLNLVTPDRDALARFRARGGDAGRVELILQVNQSSLRRAGALGAGLPPDDARPDIAALDAYVRGYAGLVDHALLDLSGGTGRPLDAAWMASVVATVGPAWLAAGITPGIAGGLGPDCEPLVRGLVQGLGPDLTPWVSWDAESRLRRPVEDPIPDERFQDTLDGGRTAAYLMALHGALRGGGARSGATAGRRR